MSIAHSLATVTTLITDASKQADQIHPVTLVAVSKQQPDEKIDAALDAGQRVFGENRVQEAISRWGHRRANYPDLRLHLIGPLQTNKVAEAVAFFDVIEVVDREKLAATLAKEMAKQDRHLPCLVQVNTGEEEQKSGISPQETVAFVRHCQSHHGLNITGLMCIPPADEEPAMHFALLAKLAKTCGLSELSMGMSGDYLEAIKFGATSVRVGSAIFGARLPRQ
ncbi:MAG: YggS family pyridoxal phosphate-dependent enzyme [Candidatus Puniceispirillales bacterium]